MGVGVPLLKAHGTAAVGLWLKIEPNIPKLSYVIWRHRCRLNKANKYYTSYFRPIKISVVVYPFVV